MRGWQSSLSESFCPGTVLEDLKLSAQKVNFISSRQKAALEGNSHFNFIQHNNKPLHCQRSVTGVPSLSGLFHLRGCLWTVWIVRSTMLVLNFLYDEEQPWWDIYTFNITKNRVLFYFMFCLLYIKILISRVKKDFMLASQLDPYKYRKESQWV